VRLVTFDAGAGRHAGALMGEEVVPAAALGAPADTVRGLLDQLDGDGLVALGVRARTGAERAILLPDAHLALVDYETEPAVVTGRRCHRVSGQTVQVEVETLGAVTDPVGLEQ